MYELFAYLFFYRIDVLIPYLLTVFSLDYLHYLSLFDILYEV